MDKNKNVLVICGRKTGKLLIDTNPKVANSMIVHLWDNDSNMIYVVSQDDWASFIENYAEVWEHNTENKDENTN